MPAKKPARRGTAAKKPAEKGPAPKIRVTLAAANSTVGLHGRRTVPHQVLPDESPRSAQLRDRLTQIELYIKTARRELAASKAIEARRLPGTPHWEEKTARLLEQFETGRAPLEGRESVRRILEALDLDGSRLLDHGRLEGELLAKRTILELQLKQRFGALPARIRKRTNSAVRSDLNVWLTRVVAAKSRADVFRE
ncbi:MAG: hypothetical protein ACOX6T_22020 [Myxococcales bacterium]|jgi:hypothetical protein